MSCPNFWCALAASVPYPPSLPPPRPAHFFFCMVRYSREWKLFGCGSERVSSSSLFCFCFFLDPVPFCLQNPLAPQPNFFWPRLPPAPPPSFPSALTDSKSGSTVAVSLLLFHPPSPRPFVFLIIFVFAFLADAGRFLFFSLVNVLDICNNSKQQQDQQQQHFRA